MPMFRKWKFVVSIVLLTSAVVIEREESNTASRYLIGLSLKLTLLPETLRQIANIVMPKSKTYTFVYEFHLPLLIGGSC